MISLMEKNNITISLLSTNLIPTQNKNLQKRTRYTDIDVRRRAFCRVLINRIARRDWRPGTASSVPRELDNLAPVLRPFPIEHRRIHE